LKHAPHRVEGLDIKLAENIEEMEAAFRLIHDKYVSYGYMEPLESGCRISKYNILPSSYTFIAFRDREIAGTLTVVTDRENGVPMDELYSRELDDLRIQGRRIGELSGLACAGENRREGYSIVADMFKYAYILSRDILGLTDFCITVNPRHRKYYERMLLFSCFGEIKPCGRVGGAPAVPLRLDLTTIEAYGPTVHPEVARYFFCEERESIRSELRREAESRKDLFKDSYFDWLEDKQPGLFEQFQIQAWNAGLACPVSR